MMNDYKYAIVESALFKKTRKLAKKRGLDMTLLQEAIRILASGNKLPAKYRDHNLKGRLSHLRECHIMGDWLLVYRVFEDKLILSLHSTGTHSDLLE
jgi:mRNA interferase YafQ